MTVRGPVRAYQPLPLPGELLSGYLCRVARSKGTTPYDFCRRHLNEKVYWARDVDRGAITRLEAAIAAQGGLGIEAVRALTLHDWTRALVPPEAGRWPAIAPWINAVGVFHRTRRLHGQQFCPECLDEVGTPQRIWRLAFVVACPNHRRALLDACPNCAEPWIPHRSRVGMLRCHVCHRLLTVSKPTTDDIPTAATLRLQEAMIATLDTASTYADATCRHALLGIHDVARALLQAANAEKRAHRDQGDDVSLPRRLETARAGVRRLVMDRCARMLARWPESFREMAKARGLRREFFGPDHLMPDWMHEEVAGLPGTRRRSVRARRPTPSTALGRRLRRIEEQRPPNWRAMQALELAHAVIER